MDRNNSDINFIECFFISFLPLQRVMAGSFSPILDNPAREKIGCFKKNQRVLFCADRLSQKLKEIKIKSRGPLVLRVPSRYLFEGEPFRMDQVSYQTEADMTKQKGPKRAKLEFTMKRIENKKTRHLKGAVLEEALAKIAAGKKKKADPVKA